MKNYADADHLHARICALKSRLLSCADYGRLIREPVSDAVASERDWSRLKENIFQEQIAPVMALVQAYDRYAPLFLAFLRQYEVRNVKTLIAQTRGKQTLQQWYDIAPYAVVQQDVLEKNISFDELKTLLTGTYLSGVFARTATPVSMSIRLDVLAAERLYEAAGALSGEAQKDFRGMVLERFEVAAALWPYRLREYYAAGDRQIRSFVEKLRRAADGPKAFGLRWAEELNRYTERELKSTGRKPTPVQIERYLEKQFYHRMLSLFHRDFHSIYCVGAYLWLLFYQIRNMFCILDGKRFGRSAESLLDNLICEG